LGYVYANYYAHYTVDTKQTYSDIRWVMLDNQSFYTMGWQDTFYDNDHGTFYRYYRNYYIWYCFIENTRRDNVNQTNYQFLTYWGYILYNKRFTYNVDNDKTWNYNEDGFNYMGVAVSTQDFYRNYFMVLYTFIIRYTVNIY